MNIMYKSQDQVPLKSSSGFLKCQWFHTNQVNHPMMFHDWKVDIFQKTASKQISFQDLVSHLDIIVALHKKGGKTIPYLHIICNQ